MKGILASDKILKVVIHILYGILPKCTFGRKGRARWYLSKLSILLVLLQWSSFCFEMHCAKTYWRTGIKGKPEIPGATLLLMISLILSAACSYTLIVVYFYHSKHQFVYQDVESILPHFRFAPQGKHEIMRPSAKKWLITNVFLMLGTCAVVLLGYCTVGLNVFFDFPGVHNFIANISDIERNIYYSSLSVTYWAFISVVVACCIFYIICQDVIQHIDFIEDLIINHARDFRTARKFHECLLHYTEKVMGSIKVWFILQNVFFFFIILSIIIDWILAFADFKKKEDLFRIGLAEISGSLLIVFKYAFPFLAASRVTSRFDKMYDRINRKCHPEEFPEIDVFMSYCERCKAGYSVFGFKVTARVALISLLSCFLRFFKVHKVI